MLTAFIKDLDDYMFSSKHMMTYNKIYDINNIVLVEQPNIAPSIIVDKQSLAPAIVLEKPSVAPSAKDVAPPAKDLAPPIEDIKPIDNTSFTPFQKDKMFWCFYVLLNGFAEYEMYKTGHYAIEKAFKISSVEKLRGMKSQIKELKIKINDVEEELVHKDKISVKGLQALCLIYKVSITYIYGKQYCEFLYNDSATGISGVIILNKNKETSLLYDESILMTLKNTHWYIENPQKPLKAPSAYTLAELQAICEKLGVSLKYKQLNAQQQIVEKNKLKKELYEDILAKM